MVAHPGDRGLTLYMGIDDQYAERYYFLRSDDTGATWQEVTSACSSNAPDCPNYSLRAAGTAPVLFQPRLWFVGLEHTTVRGGTIAGFRSHLGSGVERGPRGR